MALLIWGIAAPLMAQGNGAVTGLAIGQQGERLAGYTIAIEDLETHHVYKTKTNEKGAYVLLGCRYTCTTSDWKTQAAKNGSPSTANRWLTAA